MLKKALPVALAAGFVLTACGNNNNDMPKKDETPMEDLDDRTRGWTPEMNGEDDPNGTTGPNLDGLEDNDRDNATDGTDGGIIRDEGIDDDTLEGNGSGEGGTMGENRTEDDDNSAGTGNNGGSPKKDDRKGTTDRK